MTKISRRKFLQISGLAAGASMLPMPMKWMGAGSAEAFMQSPNTIPLYGTTLRLGEIPVALPNPLAGSALGNLPINQPYAAFTNIGAEFASNEVASAVIPGMGATAVGFPWGFPQTGFVGGQTGAPKTGVRHYSLTLQQYTDPGVVPGLGATTLWGYRPDLTLLEGLTALGYISGAHNPFSTAPGTQPQRHLGGLIVAEGGPAGQPLQLTMRNNLPLTELIPNDLTVPGANLGSDRTTVHYHGGIMPWISDGGPFDWFCSIQRTAANRRTGQSFINNVVLNPAANLDPVKKYTQGEFYYNIDHQNARFGWYHDHAFGITRTNAYAGVASGLIIRDNFERSLIALGLPPLLENSLLDGINMYNSYDGLSSATVGLTPFQTKGFWPVQEYPLVIQDKIFVGTNIKLMDSTWTGPKTAGSLWYPHTYEGSRWRRLATANKLPSNSCIAEMFGDTMLVNGTASPVLSVEPRRYRFRLLNACNARFLNLQLYVGNNTPTGITLAADASGNYSPTNAPFLNAVTTPASATWSVLANECGFLESVTSRPANKALLGAEFPYNLPIQHSLLLGSAFRPDVLVDFSNYAPGTEIILYNDCPAPFPGGDPRNDYFPAMANGNTVNTTSQPATANLARNTRCIMKFKIVANSNMNPLPPLQLTPGFNLKGLAGSAFLWNAEPQIVPQDLNGFYTVNGTYSNTPAAVWTNINGISLAAPNSFKALSLNEAFDAYGRLEQRVGSLATAPNGLAYLDAPEAVDYVENSHGPASVGGVRTGGIEVLAVYNTTADVHPMHWHMSNWQVLGRQTFTSAGAVNTPTGTMRGPLPEEFGFKETVLCWPGEIVYMIAQWDVPQIHGPALAAPFDPPASPRFPGQNVHETVWHCHILEHEEHDMMRPVLIKIVRP